MRIRTRLIAIGALLTFSLVLLTSCSQSTPGPEVLPKSVAAADETSAIQTLRTIASAQTQSKVMKGSYGDFNALSQAGLLDARFATTTPVQRGYRFTMTASEAEFSVTADPVEATASARTRHLYLDSSDGVIHVNANRAASRNDPAL
jgi:hypothetical protein